MNKNYQPVFIKTLLESPNYEATQDQIISKLKEANQNADLDYLDIHWAVIHEVLEKKPNLVEYNKDSTVLRLIVDEKLSDEQKSTLIELCDEQITKDNQSTIDPIKFQELHEKFLEDMKIEAKKMSVEPPNDEFTNFQHPYFLAEEVKYKREAAEKAQKALSLENWDEWKSEPTKIFEAVKNACQQKIHDNLITWQYLAKGKKPSIFHPSNDELINKLGIQFYDFFKGSADFPTRLDNLIQFLKDNSIPVASQVLAYLSFILDPEQYIPIRETEFKKLAVYYKCYRTSTPRFSWQFYSVFLDMLEDAKSLLAQQYDRPDTIEAHSYLWCAASLLSKTPSKKYWLIIPGDNSDMKAEFISENKITVGYRDIDLSKFYDGKPYVKEGNYKNKNSLKEIKEIIKKQIQVEEEQKLSREKIDWQEIYLHNFAGIAKNDTVILCSGPKTIFAIGKVTGEYEYLKDSAPNHVHRKAVKWYDTKEREVPKQYRFGGQGAVRLLPIDHKLRKWLFGTETNEPITAPATDSEEYQKYIDVLEYKQNMILYGPPGTGKTYHAKNIAEDLVSKNRSKTAICFPTDQGVEKIEKFQEFIDENGKAVWGVGWGVPQIQETDFPIKGYIYYRQKIIAIATITKCTEHNETTESEHKLRPTGLGYDQDYTNYLHIDKLEICRPFPHDKLELVDDTRTMPDRVQQRVYVKELHDFIKKVTFHQSFSYEEFIEGIKAKPTKDGNGVTYYVQDGIFKEFSNLAKDDELENQYVIIIDEINRGNVAKIFGELITIIEKDKRGDHVTLAYSRDEFDIPKNLYIIGTMNTADRSLTQIDAALKRRFSMMEIMPDYSVLGDQEVDGIHLGRLLEKINDGIRANGSRDNQIGHSYFMVKDENSAKAEPMTKIKDLQLAFSTDVIPLLRDYFYDNFDALSEILNNEFLESGTENLKEEWQIDSDIFVATLKKAFEDS